ncbi:hypothetical protein [Priestia flexa]|nr:hypothetical protein [Priestia flexa]
MKQTCSYNLTILETSPFVFGKESFRYVLDSLLGIISLSFESVFC